MRNSSSIAAVALKPGVSFIPEEWAEAPLTEKDQQELSRLLLYRLTVLKAALRRVEEFRRGQPLHQATIRRTNSRRLDTPL